MFWSEKIIKSKPFILAVIPISIISLSMGDLVIVFFLMYPRILRLLFYSEADT